MLGAARLHDVHLPHGGQHKVVRHGHLGRRNGAAVAQTMTFGIAMMRPVRILRVLMRRCRYAMMGMRIMVRRCCDRGGGLRGSTGVTGMEQPGVTLHE